MQPLSMMSGYLLLLVFSLISIALGIYYNKGNSAESYDEFLSARSGIPLPVAISGLIAVWVWSSTLMGSGEGAYNFGMSGIWVYGVVVPFSALVLGSWILPRVRQMMPNAATFPAYIAKRLGRNAHRVFTFVTIVQMFFWTVVQIMAVGTILNTMFGIPVWIAAVLSGIVVTLYITLGGLRAAAGTAFCQVLVITILLAILLPCAIYYAGGVHQIYDGVLSVKGHEGTLIFSKNIFFNWFLVSLFSYINYSIMDQNVWGYCYSIKPGTERKFILCSAFLWLPIPCAAGLLGVIGLSSGIQVSPSVILPAMILNLMPKIFSYGFAIIMLASIYSTAGSCLNAFTSLFINDIYIPYIKNGKPDEEKLLPLARRITVIGGLAASAVAIFPVSLLFMNYAVAAIAVPITWPFVLSVCWQKLNTKATILGMIIAIPIALVLAFLPAIGIVLVSIPLWAGYLITHLVALLIPILGTLLWPNNEFDYSFMQKEE